jgi:glucose-6-phosphate isomerase
MLNKTGAGKEFLGWLNWPYDYDKEEVARIKKASEKIRKDSEVLVVIGIGGSYLGAKAVIHALSPYFSKDKGLEVIFAGNTLSSAYLDELLK